MVIEQLKRDKAHTVKVVFVSGEAVNIDLDVCAEYALHKGQDISKAQLEIIVERSQYERAKSRALWYLDRADRTERQLKEKLKGAGFGEDTIARVIEKLIEYGLVDDRRFAERLVERCNLSGFSRTQTFYKLTEKGVPKGIANEVLSKNLPDEAQQIETVIQKKYLSKLQSQENTQKVFAALVRRGFSYAGVRQALKKYKSNTEFNGEL